MSTPTQCAPAPEDCSRFHPAPDNEIEHIHLLNHLADHLKNDLAFETKLRKTTEIAKHLAGADMAFVCLATAMGEHHRIEAVSGRVPENFGEFAVTSGKMEPEDLRKLGVTFGVTVPLQVKTRYLGLLFAGKHTPEDFTRTDQCLLSLVASLLANEIDRERSEEEHIRFETILEQAVESILITDPEGFILYVNTYFETNSGFSRQEVLGRRPAFLQSGTQGKEFYQRMWETLRKGDTWRGHLVNRRKDGSLHELAAIISPVRNRDGDITHYVSIQKDITQETSLRKQLHQAQKMEAIGTLAGGIAHDFNNLLMGIQGNISLLGMELHLADPIRKRCETIEGYIKKGADLTMQLLGIARSGKYQQVPVDIAKLVGDTLEMFGRTKKEIRIQQLPSPAPCIADVDPGQIGQVLLNLFVNAWQAMPNGGDLLVRTERVDIDADSPAMHGLKPGSHVKITVTDTGIGMDKTVMERIFDPFFTTKQKNRGTGLGLASAYGIIKNHEGIIRVQSEKGKGATFEIFLPASDKEALKETPQHIETQRGKETILLVDDEEMILDICREMLERLGYRILTAPTGNDALTLFQEHGEEIALVILDLIMPGMNGKEVFSRLTAAKPDVKVLLASGYALDSHSRDLLTQGARGFIQKPYSATGLSQKIREILLP